VIGELGNVSAKRMWKGTTVTSVRKLIGILTVELDVILVTVTLLDLSANHVISEQEDVSAVLELLGTDVMFV